MKLIESKNFSKKYSKVYKKNQLLCNKIDTVLRKLSINPFDESLRTHKLKGNLYGLYSSKVTDDIRIVFDFIQEETELCILLLSIGKHEEVY